MSRPDRPLLDGGSAWFGAGLSNEEPALPSLAEHYGADLTRPWREQPVPLRRAVLHGTGGEQIDVRYTGGEPRKGTELIYRTGRPLGGAIAEIERAYAAATGAAKRSLGYLTLGESATALSGGEAQRLKLARTIIRGRGGREPGLVILDEPVTGLHPADAQRLIDVLDLLLDRGHTVVIAEHDIHAAAGADWIIDLGPGAGPAGGRIINEGPPARVARGTGPTAPYLRRLTGKHGAGPAPRPGVS